MARTVFFVSDGTGITAETLGRSLLTQFDKNNLEFTTIPYVNTVTKARETLTKVNKAHKETNARPIVFATILNQEISKVLQSGEILFIDFFRTFIPPLEKEFGYQPEQAVGKFHSAKNYDSYMLRIDAVNYSMMSDDGSNTKDYSIADIILVGVSRSGKTPTSLYLALQFGIFAANYPITEEDFAAKKSPVVLQKYKNKLFGLIIDPARLHQIRQERLPNSRYASIEQCRTEINQIKNLFHQEQISFLDSTKRSIEELAAEILAKTSIKRRL
jgi:[pyruvate, water dikinase]-phosphate phosphotransferase / [pyruvate, water dikinase] kinase